jgi:RHS repeat-associated protein
VDILDSGSLKIQYNRNRYYDYYSGRWLTHDPLEYVDGMNLYEYAFSNPIMNADQDGLQARGGGIGGRIRRIGMRIGCRVFRRLYNSVNAPRISENEKIRRIRRLYRAIGRFGGTMGYPYAARVMRHWLSCASSDFRIPKSHILSVTEGQDAYKRLKGKVKDNVLWGL